MTIQFSSRFDPALLESPYDRIYEMMVDLRKSKIPFVSMAPGNPSTPLLPEVSGAMISHIESGNVGYTPSGVGTDEQRESAAALAAYNCSSENKPVNFTGKNTVLTSGSANGLWLVTGREGCSAWDKSSEMGCISRCGNKCEP